MHSGKQDPGCMKAGLMHPLNLHHQRNWKIPKVGETSKTLRERAPDAKYYAHLLTTNNVASMTTSYIIIVLIIALITWLWLITVWKNMEYFEILRALALFLLIGHYQAMQESPEGQQKKEKQQKAVKN